jgi:hydrogenase maturation factor
VTPAYVCTGDHCVTCSDEGVQMSVLEVQTSIGLARCADEDGAVHTVEIDLIEGATPGTVVLVHADVAIAVLGREMAADAAVDVPAVVEGVE